MQKHLFRIFILLLLITTTACEQSDEPDTPVIAVSNDSTPVTPVRNNDFVDNQQCLDCHQEQADLWTGSHHDLAMQVASVDSVLGDFGGKIGRAHV